MNNYLIKNPSDLNFSETIVPENRTGFIIGTLTVSDPNPHETFTFDLSDSRFRLVEEDAQQNLQLRLQRGIALDYETESTVTLTIGVTDSAGFRYQETFTLVGFGIKNQKLKIN